MRYNDDMLLIHEDREHLHEVMEYITLEYAKLGLQIVDKSGIQPLKTRIRFMKKTFILKESGKVIILTDSKKISEERRRLKKMKRRVDDGLMTMEKVKDHYQSFIGNMARCDSEAAVRHLDSFYESAFGEKPVYKRSKDNAYSKSKGANKKKRGKSPGSGSEGGNAGGLPGVYVNDDRRGYSDSGDGGQRE